MSDHPSLTYRESFKTNFELCTLKQVPAFVRFEHIFNVAGGTIKPRAVLSERQRKEILPYKSNLGELSRALDWLRERIIEEDREGIARETKTMREQIDEIERKTNT